METYYNILTNKSAKIDIQWHLQECDQYFKPRLSSYVDIANYANKLIQHSYRYEIWEGNKLNGLLAVYFNRQARTTFVSNLSVLPSLQGKKAAKQLMAFLIKSAKEKGFSEIRLNVFLENIKAIAFYKHMSFEVSEGHHDINQEMVLKL